jgi:hypothetical protein
MDLRILIEGLVQVPQDLSSIRMYCRSVFPRKNKWMGHWNSVNERKDYNFETQVFALKWDDAVDRFKQGSASI